MVDHLNRFPVGHYTWRGATARQLSLLAKAMEENSDIVQCERVLISEMLKAAAKARRVAENNAIGKRKKT